MVRGISARFENSPGYVRFTLFGARQQRKARSVRLCSLPPSCHCLLRCSRALTLTDTEEQVQPCLSSPLSPERRDYWTAAVFTSEVTPLSSISFAKHQTSPWNWTYLLVCHDTGGSKIRATSWRWGCERLGVASEGFWSSSRRRLVSQPSSYRWPADNLMH